MQLCYAARVTRTDTLVGGNVRLAGWGLEKQVRGREGGLEVAGSLGIAQFSMILGRRATRSAMSAGFAAKGV